MQGNINWFNLGEMMSFFGGFSYVVFSLEYKVYTFVLDFLQSQHLKIDADM